MSCITVTEVDCDTAVLVEEDSAEIVQLDTDGTVIVTEVEPCFITEEVQTVIIEEGPPEFIVSECKQGPAGVDGLDGTGIVEVESGPVLPAGVVVADSIPIATYRSCKWIVTISSVSGEFKSYEVLAVHNGSTVLFSVYALIGEPLSILTTVTIVGPNLELGLTNNTANTVSIKVQRIATTV